ncbi:hypothetical protein LQG66_05000 [Bradyrhizobium ontarionense]|uniref:CdiI immunity protein domain-containing protein n=1 Tax=Bradyrhizobium ontarionense TaxID=2898149 RepID=A0ABY3RE20_9BRAD|nr:hypothetical protein [Bradyrhizobium sp. A19]UFZ05675.1 hypothetical protein LQG66_05000 [Bradyrhizobium sp. A19]
MSSLPDHLRRYPTREAVNALCRRFGFPYHPQMQDWEWEVADAMRIDEFLSAYESGELSEDERFVLMETILQSFEDLRFLEDRPDPDPRWQRVLDILDRNIDLHAHTVWYWSVLDAEDFDDPEQQFWVTPFVRVILAKHRSRLERAPI